MVLVDLKHCGRLETVEFIAGQTAFVYEIQTHEFDDNGVLACVDETLKLFGGYCSCSKADLHLRKRQKKNCEVFQTKCEKK